MIKTEFETNFLHSDYGNIFNKRNILWTWCNTCDLKNYWNSWLPNIRFTNDDVHILPLLWTEERGEREMPGADNLSSCS